MKNAYAAPRFPSPGAACRRLAVVGLFCGSVRSFEFFQANFVWILNVSQNWNDRHLADRLLEYFYAGSPVLLLVGSTALLARQRWGWYVTLIWTIAILGLDLLPFL